MTTTTDMMMEIMQLADIVIRQGQHDFPFQNEDCEISTAVLCGLTVEMENGRLSRMQARDLDVVIEGSLLPAANDDAPHGMINHRRPCFLKGGSENLTGWHKRLSRFQTVVDFPQHKEAA